MEIDFSKFKMQWPIPLHHKLHIDTILELKSGFPLPNFPAFEFLTAQIIQLIFAICEKMNFSFHTKILALNLTEACSVLVESRIPNEFMLLVFQSVAVASKFYEKSFLSFDKIHELTDHFFTNPMLLEFELKMILFLDFDLLKNPLFKIRTNLIEFVFLVENLFPKNKFLFFLRVCEIFYEVFLMSCSALTQKITDSLICCSIIQCALVIITQNFGKFPITWRLQSFTKLDEADIFKAAKKILKICLTKEFLDEMGQGFSEEFN